MKKISKNIIITMLMFVFCLSPLAMAASGSSIGEITLKTSKSGVKSGDEFSIVISQVCNDGIIGFESKLNYDTKVFELTSSKVANEWTDLGTGTKLEAMANNDQKSGDVFTLNFKVKDNAEEKTSDIKLSGVKFYKTAEETIDVADSKVSVKVNETLNEENKEDAKPATLSKIEITKAPNKLNYKEGEKFDPAGLVVTARYSDNTSKEVKNYTYSPNAALKLENKTITVTYEENGVKKSATQSIVVTAASKENINNKVDNTANNAVKNTTINASSNTANKTANTTADKKQNKVNTVNKANTVNKTNTDSTTTTSSALPKTGNKSVYVMAVVIGLFVVAAISYIGYRKYKEI